MKNRYLLLLIICFNSNFCLSQITFQKEYGWDSTNYYASDLIQTLDNGYLMTGTNFQYTPVNPPIGGVYNGSYIVKTDANGDTIWTRHFAEGLYGSLFKVFELPDSTIVFLGDKDASVACDGFLNTHFYEDLVFLKLDHNGNYLDFAQYVNDCNENIMDAISTLDGGFAILGMHSESSPMGSSANPVMYKIDATGSLQWVQNYSNSYYWVNSFLQRTDSSYFFTGSRFVTGIDYDANLTQTNAAGDTLNCVYIADTAWQTGWKLLEADASSNFLLMARDGSSNYNYVPRTAFYKIDSVGNLIWVKKYQFSGNDIVPQYDGGFLVSGTELTQSPYDSLNMYVVKLNSNGDSLWSKNYGGIKRDINAAICSTADGGYAVLGTKDFFNYTPNGSRYFLVKDSLLTTGINTPVSRFEYLSIAPNPTTGIINFNHENLLVALYDISGKKLSEQKVAGKQININNFSSGIYFLSVRDGNAEKKFKIIKQ